jgi:hypothetical protein
MINIFIAYFLFMFIDVKLCLRFPVFKYYESIVLDWMAFVSLSNLYGLSFFIEFVLIASAKENKELMDSFPDYAVVYNKQYLQFLIAAIVYPFIWMGASIYAYIKLEYFRQMVALVQLECFGLFTAALVVAIGFICIKVFFVRDTVPNPPEVMSVSSFEGK